MSLKILGGKAKGFTISVPPADTIRPMQVMLKRRVFDSYQNLEGVTFVDLCAGSGAVGLEAWSRGADEIYYSEFSKRVYKVFSKNITNFTKQYFSELQTRPIQYVNKHCLQYLKDFQHKYATWSQDKKENTILFFAPPYPSHEVYEETLNYIRKSKWFVGQMWVESCENKGPSRESIQDWGKDSHKEYTQGSTFLLIVNY